MVGLESGICAANFAAVTMANGLCCYHYVQSGEDYRREQEEAVLHMIRCSTQSQTREGSKRSRSLGATGRRRVVTSSRSRSTSRSRSHSDRQHQTVPQTDQPKRDMNKYQGKMAHATPEAVAQIQKNLMTIEHHAKQNRHISSRKELSAGPRAGLVPAQHDQSETHSDDYEYYEMEEPLVLQHMLPSSYSNEDSVDSGGGDDYEYHYHTEHPEALRHMLPSSYEDELYPPAPPSHMPPRIFERGGDPPEDVNLNPPGICSVPSELLSLVDMDSDDEDEEDEEELKMVTNENEAEVESPKPVPPESMLTLPPSSSLASPPRVTRRRMDPPCPDPSFATRERHKLWTLIAGFGPTPAPPSPPPPGAAPKSKPQGQSDPPSLGEVDERRRSVQDLNSPRRRPGSNSPPIPEHRNTPPEKHQRPSPAKDEEYQGRRSPPSPDWILAQSTQQNQPKTKKHHPHQQELQIHELSIAYPLVSSAPSKWKLQPMRLSPIQDFEDGLRSSLLDEIEEDDNDEGSTCSSSSPMFNAPLE